MLELLLLQTSRSLILISGMVGSILMISMIIPSAYADTLRTPPTTTIHVEDPELCNAYPVSTKALTIKKVSGRPLSSDAYAGRQITIEALLSANCYGTMDEDGRYLFLTLIEIRDSDGITQYLALQQGTIEPWTEVPIGFSWIPDRPGEYEVRSFSMPDLHSTVFLAKIVSITVTVILDIAM